MLRSGTRERPGNDKPADDTLQSIIYIVKYIPRKYYLNMKKKKMRPNFD